MCRGDLEGEVDDGVCYDDLSTADGFGDDCTDYTENPGWCGNYDNADFNSMTQCCICSGGATDDVVFPVEPEEDDEPAVCVNDLSSADSYGDDCD